MRHQGSELEPDVMLLMRRADFYACAHPEPPDVRLLIEVADSSVRFDHLTKFSLYARAGIAEAWLVDVAGARGYEDVRAPGREDHFSPLAFPDISVTLADLLG